MGIFVIDIISLIVSIVFAVLLAKAKTKDDKRYCRIGFIVALVLGIVLTIASFLGSIPTGYTGIVTTFGKVQNDTLDAGIHFKAPWNKIVKMDNREQRISFDLGAFSSDIQEVQVKGSVTLSIDKSTAMTLYKNVGTEYVDVLVRPRLQEDVKAVFASYTAEGLVSNRNVLSSEVLARVAHDLNDRGLNIISVSIEDIDFTDAFTNAVEAKQVASQELQKAKTQQEQQTMEAEQAAERKKIQAQAEADVAKINADADAYAIKVRAESEAEANMQIAASITDSLIEYTQVQQWNGALPQVYGGLDMMPIVNLGN